MKKLLTLSVAALMSMGAMAQDECTVNYSIYKEFLNVESYSNALPAFRKVFNECPQFRKSVYIDGVKLYKGMISKTTDQNAINAYVDTLKIIYNQRIANFGEEANVLNRCAADVMKYRKSDTAYQEAYHLFQRSVAASNGDPELSAVSPYFQLSMTLYSKGSISSEQLFNDIVPNMMLVKKLESSKDDTYKATAAKVFTNLTATFGKLNCQSDFNKYFDAKYTLSDDMAEVQTLSETMSDLGCEGSALYAQSAEKLYQTNPTASAAAAIARYNRKSQQYDKAAQYYAEAIAGETDNIKKSALLYEAATVANYRKKYSEAVSLAKKSAEANPQNGAPYLLIGAVYGANANLCATDAFVRREVYWVAADYVQKAKKADPSLEADANNLLRKYAALFPDKEDAFMHSVKPGDVVRLTGFDTEVTTARF